MTTMREQALNYLRISLGRTDAEFRDGQWESIQAVLARKRLLVVERTGWGKSMVYFLATRLLRDSGAGVTLLISPLLSLMRNQLEAAQRIGLSAAISLLNLESNGLLAVHSPLTGFQAI